MKEFFKQQTMIWRAMRGLHKGLCLACVLSIVAGLCCIVCKTSQTHWIPLFPGKEFSAAEIEGIEIYLMDTGAPYRIDPEQGVLISSDKAAEARSGFSSIQKGAEAKGYELFDTNTWIKGEKELQVLEMRALKGQLERDLCAFENIKGANVILDIPPQKCFNVSKFQTKASVILTLMPKEHVSASQLRAITNHLAGAVRGLEPQMIAISDTTGKLYKSIDPKGEEECFHNDALLLEEHVEKKVTTLLSHLVGHGHFYCTVQAALDKASGTVHALSLSVVIDANSEEISGHSLRGEIERQLASLVKGYGITDVPTVDWIPFKKTCRPTMEAHPSNHHVGLIFTLIFGVAVVAALILFLRKSHHKKKDEEAIFKLMTRVDMKKLAESLADEDPQTIALMLSYLEPQKAEEMITSLNQEVQEEVLFYLSELEKRGIQ